MGAMRYDFPWILEHPKEPDLSQADRRISVLDGGRDTLDRFHDHDFERPAAFKRPRPHKSSANYLWPFTMFLRYLHESATIIVRS